MTTILAGRLYPSNAVFATVCDAKGTEDEKAILRLSQFIKDSGVPKLVYKSDQERAIATMTEEALRRAGRNGQSENLWPSTMQLVKVHPMAAPSARYKWLKTYSEH